LVAKVNYSHHDSSQGSIILPLYSVVRSEKRISEKSGLNQWNGGGRRRIPGESYTPVPSLIHELYPTFFPKRDQSFELELPNGQHVSAKLCQSGRKALMSAPNSSLNFWLFELIDGSLNQVLNRFRDKRPYQYEDLVVIGFDCVVIDKQNDGSYKMSRGYIGQYERQVRSKDGL
jgi:hypothetical protein